MKKRILALAMATTLVVGALATPVDAAKKPKISDKRLELTVGATKTLKVKNISKKVKVKWSTSQKKVANISQKGKITAKNPGNAKITAKVGKAKLTCKVTVKAPVTEVITNTKPPVNTEPQPVVTHTHSFTETITKQATCTEAGVKTLTCSCGEYKTEAIPTTEHDYEKEYTIDVPDCISEGVKSRHCKNCDSRIDEIVTPMQGHASHTISEVPATENEPAYSIEKCIRCGNTWKVTVGCEHGYENYIGGHCSICYKTCEHDYDEGIMIEAPTCTEDGWISFTCKICGVNCKVGINAVEHIYKNGTCIVCNNVDSTAQNSVGVLVDNTAYATDKLVSIPGNSILKVNDEVVTLTHNRYRFTVDGNYKVTLVLENGEEQSVNITITKDLIPSDD